MAILMAVFNDNAAEISQISSQAKFTEVDSVSQRTSLMFRVSRPMSIDEQKKGMLDQMIRNFR